MKHKQNISDKELLEVFNASYLTLDDIKWLKSKRWFKRFLKLYSKELKKRYNDLPEIKEINNKLNKKEEVEILDFTQSISLPNKEIVEILDFTKTLDIKSIKEVTEVNENVKRRIRFEKRLFKTIICICFIIIFVISLVIISWFLENNRTSKTLSSINDIVKYNKVPITSSAFEDDDLYVKYQDMDMLDVNVSDLLKINNETKGWIKVSGTNINYPFVKTDNNEYYLKHSFDKTYNKKGWVFLDFRNNIDSLSKNTILYAHGLVNNQMFGSIRTVFSNSWYNNVKNGTIMISTINNNQIWKIFSIYTIEPEGYYITTNFQNTEDFSKFISVLKTRSIHDFNVDVSENDNILTLSSCYDSSKRMVIHAKLLHLQPK